MLLDYASASWFDLSIRKLDGHSACDELVVAFPVVKDIDSSIDGRFH